MRYVVSQHERYEQRERERAKEKGRVCVCKIDAAYQFFNINSCTVHFNYFTGHLNVCTFFKKKKRLKKI